MELFDFAYRFPTTIEEIDKFDGKEFEIFLFHFFKEMNFHPRLTDDTNDKGIDLIIRIEENGNIRHIGVQAKRWKSKVGAEEIRSMLDGKEHYNLTELWIVTTSDLTSAAITTAMNNRIQILKRDKVIDFLNVLKSKNVKFKESPKVDKVIGISPNEFDPLFILLKNLRRDIAREQKLSAVYMVFNNQTIQDIIDKKPKTLEDLKGVYGLGEAKINSFGTRIIDLLAQHETDQLAEDFLKTLRIKIMKFNKLSKLDDVFTNEDIIRLAKIMPESMIELENVKVLDTSRLRLFGDYLVNSIKKFKEPEHSMK